MATIIVTGATGGIGKAIVKRLVAQGMSVLACDRDASALKSLVAEFPKAKITTETFDVTDPEAMSRFMAALDKRLPDLAGLVNNAGIYLGRDLFDYSAADMERVLGINLLAPILLTQAIGRILVRGQRKGAIVNISSISAFEGSSDALYGTSKAGLIGLTKATALTFAPWVRVNAVAPGLVDTSMLNAIPKWRLEEFEKGERLKERITPDAVAASVWFLLSDESKHTTGSVIDLNNGGYFR